MFIKPKSSEKEFSKLTKDIKQSIYQFLIKNVSVSPRNHGKQLKGSNTIKLWRYRVRDYRLICQIKDQEITVLIIRIGNRDSVYKDRD
ncbi:type II toxin-antitoxin system RelE family toxin [Rickettsia endosymbiont of Halotydeus destructor]|uniref:type II toxin-antitoxin system RelE family toxin n=1 Tax=Rickettsia endosymbiont of Halotydeus destructor TaxID=2996754 RepID=UPI003BAF591E